MASRAYELYGVPVPPEDPDKDVMTVQETAYVMKCSVSWLRKFLAANRDLHGYSGRRIVTDKQDRRLIYEAMRAAPRSGVRRRRRPVAA
ncbi:MULTISPECIES: DNA-binding protein [unclassified Streptomyces]|uniref:DNA-binding protein n=1 Tax=unclassified Streptomyces TaxID=2593676 RepID=UPI0036ED63BF